MSAGNLKMNVPIVKAPIEIWEFLVPGEDRWWRPFVVFIGKLAHKVETYRLPRWIYGQGALKGFFFIRGRAERVRKWVFVAKLRPSGRFYQLPNLKPDW